MYGVLTWRKVELMWYRDDKYHLYRQDTEFKKRRDQGFSSSSICGHGDFHGSYWVSLGKSIKAPRIKDRCKHCMKELARLLADKEGEEK